MPPRDQTAVQSAPVPAGMVQRVAAGLRYAVAGVLPNDWFGPSQPLPPQAPASVVGRSFDYPVGYNVLARPRSEEPISFHQLRGLAESYDLLRLIIETRKDQVEKLDWTLQQRRDAVRSVDPAKVRALRRFMARPDGEHNWTQWLRLLLEDLLVLDAPALYLCRTVSGQPYALEVIDGATIKRVLDERGRTPVPPSVAYQQVLKGLPAVDYGADELLYLPRNPRPHKIYGMSPVEQIVMTVNIALRRQVSLLSYYTEGNTPEALIGVPDDWTPDQISQFQAYWDSLLEGNLAARRHTKFVPGGLKYQPLREPALKDEFDEWLARVVCFAFSLPPTAFVKQTNRATAEMQQETATTEGLVPLQRWVKELMDRLLADYFGEPELEFQWAITASLDPLVQAQVNQIYLAAGVKTVADVREELGLGKDLLAVLPTTKLAKFRKAGFDPDQPGWHKYKSGPNLVCTAQQNCTSEEMADALSRYAIPGQDPDIPIQSGHPYWVHDPETGIRVGQVVIVISDNGLAVLNTTLPLHILYDGQVVRTATQSQDGSWFVTTYGIGNNVIPGMNEFNQDAGPNIFKTLDQNMAAAIAKKGTYILDTPTYRV